MFIWGGCLLLQALRARYCFLSLFLSHNRNPSCWISVIEFVCLKMEFEIFLFMIWRRTENPFETEFASNGSHPISNVKNNELLQIWVDCKFKNKRRKNKSRTFDVTKCDDSILHIAEKRFWCLFVCVTWNYAIKMSHSDLPGNSLENFVNRTKARSV